MRWRAEWVTEPAKDHDHCMDLYEDDTTHRARLQWNDSGEAELVCYGDRFAVPADWLAGLIQRFIADTGSLGPRARP